MKCECCDRRLSNKESVTKWVSTGGYTDTCFKCLKEIGVPYISREDVPEDEEADDLEDIIDEEFNSEEEDER